MFLGVSLAAAVVPGQLRAANQTWTNAPVDNTWANVNNWIGKATPGDINATAGNSVNNDVATFNSPTVGGIGSASNPILPDDATVVRTIRSFLKAIEETIAALKDRDSSRQQQEKAILEAYLPASLDADQLTAAIQEIVDGLPDRSPKAMGQVMAQLKSRFGDAVDMKEASRQVKLALG